MTHYGLETVVEGDAAVVSGLDHAPVRVWFLARIVRKRLGPDLVQVRADDQADGPHSCVAHTQAGLRAEFALDSETPLRGIGIVQIDLIRSSECRVTSGSAAAPDSGALCIRELNGGLAAAEGVWIGAVVAGVNTG